MHTDSTATRSQALSGTVFIALLLLLFPIALISQSSSVKTADAVCSRCHQQIYNKYLTTPMANASGLASDKLLPGTFANPATSMQYEVALAGKDAALSYQDHNNPSAKGSLPLDYFLGSGHLGTTYLYSIDKFLFESPVAWYADLHGYDMKPGLAAMKTMPPSLPMQSSCLRCHMSAVQPSEPGTLNLYRKSPFLHTGITCEACHGDSQRHATNGGKSGTLNPVKLNADQRDSICINCHLEGDVTVERAGHSPLDYRPGESIAKYLAFYVYGGADPTSRGVSEVEQFAKSTCKQVSGDKMSCTSCHDPHFTPDAQQRTAFFRKKCLACHSEPQFAATHHPDNPDCTSCHMTRTGSQNIPHVAWTDHRILRIPATPNPASPDGERKSSKQELAAVFSPGATGRDLAMAYYLVMLEGDRSAEPKAWTLLNQEKPNLSNDPAALDALGVLTVERRDTKAAEQIFKSVLELSPNDLTALSNLGIIEARQGSLKEATALLQKAYDRNADISGLAMNLARLQCAAGNSKAARATLEVTLTYNPNLESVRRLMQDLSDCGKVDGK